jgi:hypothetical protein
MVSISYIRKRWDVGRKKLWTERLTLPLSGEMLAQIDAALGDDEVRLDFIRFALERELKRRKLNRR